jgi:hypothetical protein
MVPLVNDQLEPAWRKRDWAPIAAVLLGVGYGVLARLTFGLKWSVLDGLFAAVSLMFLFAVPFVFGALTVAYASSFGSTSWLTWVFRPWLACLLLAFVFGVLAWEGAICLVVAAPIYLFMSSLGGVIAGLHERSARRRGLDTSRYRLGLVLALPFALSPLEQRVTAPTEHRLVETSVHIAADAHTVFRNLAEVSEIRSDEQHYGFFQSIGIPRPLQATLSYPGVGGIRDARFVEGIRFVETVTRYEPGRSLAFTIAVDPGSIAPGTLDEHVRVGGSYFDAEYGEFRIEPRPEGGVLLHLLSRHRVATHFNFYARLWTDAIMRDLQSGICAIIRDRSEREARAERTHMRSPSLSY